MYHCLAFLLLVVPTSASFNLQSDTSLAKSLRRDIPVAVQTVVLMQFFPCAEVQDGSFCLYCSVTTGSQQQRR